MLGQRAWPPADSLKMRTEPSSRRTFAALVAAFALLVLAPAAAQAESLHVVFPQSVAVTVVQGQTTNFNMEIQAFGATSCSADSARLRVNTLFSVDAAGDVAQGQVADIPIQTADTRGSSDNCSIKNPVEVPLTVTAASATPVGDYSTIINWGKGGDGDVSEIGPPLTIHVIPPPVQPVIVLPPPVIIVLGERAPAPRPTLGKTVMLNHVKGNVLFQEPGGSVQALSGTVIVPNGTTVDATKGTVKVTVEHSAGGVLDSVDAWGGAFVVVQMAPQNGNPAITVMTLTDPIAVPKNGASAASVQGTAARTTRKHSLWANGTGNFKTRGKRASAIVRGTYWYTEDVGSKTTVAVKRGLVAVRDFVKKKTVLVSEGHSYTAKVKTRIARRPPAFTGSVRGR